MVTKICLFLCTWQSRQTDLHEVKLATVCFLSVVSKSPLLVKMAISTIPFYPPAPQYTQLYFHARPKVGGMMGFDCTSFQCLHICLDEALLTNEALAAAMTREEPQLSLITCRHNCLAQVDSHIFIKIVTILYSHKTCMTFCTDVCFPKEQKKSAEIVLRFHLVSIQK